MLTMPISCKLNRSSKGFHKHLAAMSTVLLALVGFPSTTLAAPGDFFGSKFSPFGAELDNSPPITQCPRCDATLSFTGYETIDNWTTELGFTPTTLLGSTDGTEQYVLFYQVVNTDTIPPEPDDAQLFEFFLSVQQNGKPYFGRNPYKSAGYISDTVFNSASSETTPLDAPSDFNVDSELIFDGFTTLVSAVEPTEVTYGEIFDDEVQVRGGPSPTNGLAFNFDPPIPLTDASPDAPGGLGTSSLLFVTVDEQWFTENVNPNQRLTITYPWGRTESIHPEGEPANGTSGDVIGVNISQVPEPNSVLGLMTLSLLGMMYKVRKSH